MGKFIKPLPATAGQTASERQDVKVLKQKVGATLKQPAMTQSNGSVARKVAGSKQAGGARISGGSV